MTRITTSILTLVAILGTSAGLAAVATPLLASPDQSHTPAAAKPAQVQTVSATGATAPAPQFAPARDGQRTVRVVYAGPTTAP
jgi:ABC-type phosphate transport system substrate-binding protein